MKPPVTPGEILLEAYLAPMGIWSPRRPIFAGDSRTSTGSPQKSFRKSRINSGLRPQV